MLDFKKLKEAYASRVIAGYLAPIPEYIQRELTVDIVRQYCDALKTYPSNRKRADFGLCWYLDEDDTDTSYILWAAMCEQEGSVAWAWDSEFNRDGPTGERIAMARALVDELEEMLNSQEAKC